MIYFAYLKALMLVSRKAKSLIALAKIHSEALGSDCGDLQRTLQGLDALVVVSRAKTVHVCGRQREVCKE